MTEEHPLSKALAEWLPDVDFAVLEHRFAPHGRDYILILQADAGTYELTLTHVVSLNYETRLSDQNWPSSWDDAFTDYATWEAAGRPDGHVWGTHWSLAYPGLDLIRDDPEAASWSGRVGKSFSAIRIETNRFMIRVVFHSARYIKLSDDKSALGQVTIPIAARW